jgi:hypothetical protein
MNMHIDLNREKAKSMPSIGNPETIEGLRVWFCNYKTLEPVAEFRNLRTLAIAGYPDTTLNVLKGLKKLNYLRILHLPKVNDLSPLAELESLESLSLATLPSWDASSKKTIVESLAPISKLPNLKHLELFGVVSKDKSLSAIEKCESLITARFSKYPKREIERFFKETKVANAHAPIPNFKAG